jgi:hypothetical protein
LAARQQQEALKEFKSEAMRNNHLLLSLLILLLSALRVDAATYTVKAGGGGSFTTVQACANTAVAGDNCVIYAGSYNENVTPANNGSAGSPITFSTNPGDSVTVSGFSLNSGATYINITGTAANLMNVPNAVTWSDHATHLILQYLSTTGGGCYGGSGWYTSGTPTSYNQFLNLTINNCGGTGAGAAGPGIELEGDHNLFDNITCSYAQACITFSGEFNVIRNSHFGPTSAFVLGSQHSQPIENSVSCPPDIAGGSQHSVIENNTSIGWGGLPGQLDSDAHALVLMTDTSPSFGCGTIANIFRYNQGMDSGSYSVQVQDSQQHYWYNNSFSNTQLANGSKDLEDFTFDPGNTNLRAINNIFSNMVRSSTTSWCIFADAPLVENHNLCYTTGGPGTWFGPSTDNSNGYDPSDIFNSDPKFVGPDTNLTLQAGSPAIGKGGPLTTAVGTGAASTSLTVADAGFFSWGFGIPNVQPDWIRIGPSTTAQIASINYSSNVITLASPVSWSSGSPVYLYKNSNGTIVLTGASPNIGFDFLGGSAGGGAPQPPLPPTNLQAIPK